MLICRLLRVRSLEAGPRREPGRSPLRNAEGDPEGTLRMFYVGRRASGTTIRHRGG